MNTADGVATFNRYFIDVKKVWDKPTVRQFSATTATLFLIAFFLFVALKPTVETIFTLNKKIQDLQDIEQLMTKKISDINLAINTYQTIQPDLSLLDEYYPPNPNTAQVVKILETNSKKSGIPDPNFNLSSYQLQGGKGLFNLTFTVDNSYPNILNFMKNLDNAKRLINITGFSFTQTKDKDRVGLSLNSDVYYEKR
jgi:hypothetical protein